MANNNANNGYPIPELSSILATLAQFAPQSTPQVSQPHSQQQFDSTGSTTPPGQPSSSQDPALYLQPLLHPAAPVSNTSTPPPPFLHPSHFLHVQDPRLRNRSRTQTPDSASLPQLIPGLSLPGTQQGYPPTSQGGNSSYSALPQEQHDDFPSIRPQQRAPSAQGLIIDPAAITEWTAGLRCVNKISAQNRDFAGAIKRVRLSSFLPSSHCLVLPLMCQAY